MLITSNQLNEKQLKDLANLAELCQQKDQTFVNYYPNLLAEKREFPASALYYREGKLIAFMAVFFFAEDNCEISLMVLPEERRRGLAKKLLMILSPLIRHLKIKTLIFTAAKKEKKIN
jgi:N-acetylglutamate synthase-like GNAT family acetyltransferase